MSSAVKLDQKYTYKDYKTWPEEERWELINGIAYNMSPAPKRIHQKVSLNLERIIADFLDNRPCEMYHAPFDVRLPERNETDDKIQTVVQPDIVVVCDENKLDEYGCKGAPDLIIEILSESTAAKDLSEKMFLYERHGVKEYWIVDPWSKTVSIRHFLQNERKYSPIELYNAGDTITVKLFKGLQVDLNKLFK